MQEQQTPDSQCMSTRDALQSINDLSLQMDSISLEILEGDDTISPRTTIRTSNSVTQPLPSETQTSPNTAKRKRRNLESTRQNATIPDINPSKAPASPQQQIVVRDNTTTTAHIFTSTNETDSEPEEDLSAGVTFFPSIAFGEKESHGLSKIGRADKQIKIWEEVVRVHEEGLPHLAPLCREFLKEAQEARAALPETEENLRVGEINPAESAIKERLEVLQWALSTCGFEPERQNIAGAMKAYRNGEIGYNEHYTLLWNGRVVDTCDSYRQMVRGRTKRLDQYERDLGPGWLWWEPPLNIPADDQPRMCLSANLKRERSANGLAFWYVKQGFWKRAHFVRRMPETAQAGPAPEDATFARDATGKVWCGDEGPRLSFRSLLDSGATYPTLHNQDLYSLGIHPSTYGAQSAQMFSTANGPTMSRVYELFVTVLNDNGTSLVGQPRVHPKAPPYLGGLCPVSQVKADLVYDRNGNEVINRLSGLLPFVACYLSITPSKGSLYLGEDRNDVLGGQRMPGQRRWQIGQPFFDDNPFGISEALYGNPRVSFVHAKGAIVNEDDQYPHSSRTVFNPGEPHQTIHRVNPRTDAVERTDEERALDDVMQHLFRRHSSAPDIKKAMPTFDYSIGEPQGIEPDSGEETMEEDLYSDE